MDDIITRALQETEVYCRDMCEIVDQYARHPDGDAKSKEMADKLYQLAAEMQVKFSQITDCKDVYEGPCRVDNICSKVVVDGFSVRGNIEFEVLWKGKWVKGHRANTQYGQVFLPDGGLSELLEEGTPGRVTHPLEMG